MASRRKRNYKERASNSENEDNSKQRSRKKRKTSKCSNRSKSSKKTRKSKRLANKNRLALSEVTSHKNHTISSSVPNTDTHMDDDERNEDNMNDDKCKTKVSPRQVHKHNQYLFDDTCLYSLLEVFLVGYDLKYESVRDDLWEWLWFWEQRASAFYRILITPVYEHNLFEIRVDSVHGIHCGLLSQFLLTGLTFEYYYAYSRDNIWGGWQFCSNHKVLKHDIYGKIFGDAQCIDPSKIWKQIIWFKQLKMELMYKKYGGINMNKMHLTHYYYGHHNFNQIDGNHDVYINKFPPYQTGMSASNNSNKKMDKFDVYSYNMAQIFDNSWSKNHVINRNSIQLNVDDLSLILGTKEKMKCAQCYQTFHLCRAIKLCDCFKGCFVFDDLYHRHKSMVMDWK
eukprot:234159_1